MIILAAASACWNTRDYHDTKKDNKGLSTAGNNKGFAVVELFTSEGCSSCPPADELVASIQAANKDKNIYILAFHVDYWDHQGWKDRFSDKAYSNRQRQYAEWLNLSTIYTPQIVVNGSSECVGNNASAVTAAISEGLNQQSVQSLTLDCGIAGQQLKVNVKDSGLSGNARLTLALVQRSADSQVKAGENAGRQLSHVQIVRQLKTVTTNDPGITLDLPKDFTKEGWELIGFIQDSKTGHITAATKYNF